jgi:2-polyprenyl-3-methyl-5-hydroxy-6-metoxy-1,4-benzoquinol methylase
MIKSRKDIQKEIEPIVERCRQFEESLGKAGSPIPVHLLPDLKRISLIASLALGACGDNAAGEGLEIGCGYSALLFSMATLMPGVQWWAVEHPGREYLKQEGFHAAFREFKCQLKTTDIIRDGLPFEDGRFSTATFSEVLEHLPVERLGFVLSEIARVIRPGGFLIASSPNQASLENRLLLLRGKSILEMPQEKDFARGTFGHIRLYTLPEMKGAMLRLGFTPVRCVLESNNSGYRGSSEKSLARHTYRMYERLERVVPALKRMGDTWYAVFNKQAGGAGQQRK